MSQAWNGTKKESPERRTYTVEDITQILGIGRTSAYPVSYTHLRKIAAATKQLEQAQERIAEVSRISLMLRLFSFPKECPARGFSGNPVPQRIQCSFGDSVLLDRRINLDVLNELGSRAFGDGAIVKKT